MSADDHSGTPPRVAPAADPASPASLASPEPAEAASAIGALADDTRRALHDYVLAQDEPVGREQAATALGLPQHRAAFHLDRLADEGLLEVEFRRLTGRTGPGAGRPSKLYRPSAREFAVSVPPRRYTLVGDILATAVDRAVSGVPLEQSLRETAHEEGRAVGGSAQVGAGEDPDAGQVDRVAAALARTGYQPRVADAGITLANCPFDALARRHTELVCGLNHTFVQGVVEGAGADELAACLEPGTGACCVRVRPSG